MPTFPLPSAPPLDSATLQLIQLAIQEDLGDSRNPAAHGDKTVELAIPPELIGAGNIVARKPGIIAGTYLFPAILQHYGPNLAATILVADGQPAAADQIVARISGSVRGILSSERMLLNFLSRLSGVASLTRRYVDAMAKIHAPGDSPPIICDTRKTTPGYRMLEKFAVRCGGGVNHRMGLYDGVMLKDNHLAALRHRLGKNLTLAQLTARIRGELPQEILLWLEVDSLRQLTEALPAGGADIILLDNMPPEMLRQAVAIRNAQHPGRPLLEASGGITLENIAAVAATGVERIAIGALTHSAPILDLSLDML